MSTALGKFRVESRGEIRNVLSEELVFHVCTPWNGEKRCCNSHWNGALISFYLLYYYIYTGKTYNEVADEYAVIPHR